MNRKDVIKSVNKARKAAQKAADEAARADAMVSTYWKSKLRPFMVSQDFRAAAGLSYSLSLTLQMLLAEDAESEQI